MDEAFVERGKGCIYGLRLHVNVCPARLSEEPYAMPSCLALPVYSVILLCVIVPEALNRHTNIDRHTDHDRRVAKATLATMLELVSLSFQRLGRGPFIAYTAFLCARQVKRAFEERAEACEARDRSSSCKR